MLRWVKHRLRVKTKVLYVHFLIRSVHKNSNDQISTNSGFFMARPIVQLFGFFIMLNRVRFTQYTVNKISYSNKASVLNPVFSKTVILTETTVSLSLIFKSVRPKQDYTQVKYCNFIFFLYISWPQILNWNWIFYSLTKLWVKGRSSPYTQTETHSLMTMKKNCQNFKYVTVMLLQR